jgi:hypothetical protein
MWLCYESVCLAAKKDTCSELIVKQILWYRSTHIGIHGVSIKASPAAHIQGVAVRHHYNLIIELCTVYLHFRPWRHIWLWELMNPYYLDSRLTDGNEVTLARRLGSTRQKHFLLLISVRGFSQAQSHNAAGSIRWIEKKFNDLFRPRSRYLLAFFFFKSQHFWKFVELTILTE